MLKSVEMYKSNLLHFLDDEGKIPEEMNREGREMACFHALVVDAATGMMPSKYTISRIRCFKKGCRGTVLVRLSDLKDEIEWLCPECRNDGRISHWQGTRWDNSKSGRSGNA